MCLYPKLILNKKYLPNGKNGGKPPKLEDPRVQYVAVGCGKCMECRKQKKRQWQVRLQEEISKDNSGKFITLSFSDEELAILEDEVLEIQRKNAYDIEKMQPLQGYDLDNEVATLATRRFLELWRKRNGNSVKHWFITELGTKKTERIHIHGIIFTNDLNSIKKSWKYGNIWIGNYCGEKTVNYIVKYVHKQDEIHPNYIPKILTSPGIGKCYLDKPNRKLNEFKGTETKDIYYTAQGLKLALPIYYRNKIYSEKQREQLWINLIEKGERYVNGIKVNTADVEAYYNLLEQARRLNKQLGYGDDKKNWDKINYERKRRALKRMERIEKLNEPPIKGTHEKRQAKYKRLAKICTQASNLSHPPNDPTDKYITWERMQKHRDIFENDKDTRIADKENARREAEERNQNRNPLVFRGEVDFETGEIKEMTLEQGTIWKNW